MAVIEEQKWITPYEALYGVFMAVFVTFVILTNTVGVKLFSAFGLILPVSIIWFPLTFLVTDIVSEMYGAKRARFLVIMGFTMSLILLGFSQIGLNLQPSEIYAADEAYVRIFGPVWRLLFASMTAYLLAQMVDVHLFHFWKRLTKGKHLWLRNNASTMISQLVDTVIVNVIFLYKNPAVFTGNFSDLMNIIFSVYILKIAIAALDTPFCYLGVWAVEKMTGVKGEEVE